MDPKTISLLRLQNPDWSSESRIAVVSLPLPVRGKLPAGFVGVATQSQDIAWWPDSQSGRKRAPRRRLMFAMSEDALPSEFRFDKPGPIPRKVAAVDARVRTVDEDLRCMLPYKVGEVVFRWKNRSLALR